MILITRLLEVRVSAKILITSVLVFAVVIALVSSFGGSVAGRTGALQAQPTTEAAMTVTTTQPGSTYTSTTTTTSSGTTIATTTTITHLAVSTSTTTQRTFLTGPNTETRTETASRTTVEMFTTTTGIGVPRTIITTLIIRSTATVFFGGYTYTTITIEIRTTFPDSTTTRTISVVSEGKASTGTTTITYPGSTSTITSLVPTTYSLTTITGTSTNTTPTPALPTNTTQLQPTPALSTSTEIAVAGVIVIILALAFFKLHKPKAPKSKGTTTDGATVAQIGDQRSQKPLQSQQPILPQQPMTRQAGQYCINCGTTLPVGSKFCSHCDSAQI